MTSFACDANTESPSVNTTTDVSGFHQDNTESRGLDMASGLCGIQNDIVRAHHLSNKSSSLSDDLLARQTSTHPTHMTLPPGVSSSHVFLDENMTYESMTWSNLTAYQPTQYINNNSTGHHRYTIDDTFNHQHLDYTDFDTNIQVQYDVKDCESEYGGLPAELQSLECDIKPEVYDPMSYHQYYQGSHPCIVEHHNGQEITFAPSQATELRYSHTSACHSPMYDNPTYYIPTPTISYDTTLSHTIVTSHNQDALSQPIILSAQDNHQDNRSVDDSMGTSSESPPGSVAKTSVFQCNSYITFFRTMNVVLLPGNIRNSAQGD